MNKDQKVIREVVGDALSGKGAHVATKRLFAGLDWKLAGVQPEGVPHTIFELMSHMTYWQEWVVKWLGGGKPSIPKHAAGSWPKSPAPAGRKEWLKASKAFQSSLTELDRQARKGDLLASRGKDTRLRMIHAIASHSSYHGGQVAFLRQMLGAWPPPSGGLTW